MYSGSIFGAEHDFDNRFAGKNRFWPPEVKIGSKMTKNEEFLFEKKVTPKHKETYIDWRKTRKNVF